MVPRQQLDAAREAAAQAELETARLRERLERMVPRSDLLAREADNERLAAEVGEWEWIWPSDACKQTMSNLQASRLTSGQWTAGGGICA